MFVLLAHSRSITYLFIVQSGNAHVIPAFNQNFGITTNQRWTLALSIFYVGYCASIFAVMNDF